MGEGVAEEEKRHLHDQIPLDERPGVLVIGSPNVGKRTLISRLLSVELEDSSESLSEVLLHGWTIDTKYYTADVSVWVAHLCDGFSIEKLPIVNQLAALVMVFDMTDLSSFAAIHDWVSHTDIKKFEVLLCMGNKVDLLPGHPAHAEYRRHLQNKLGDSFSDSYPDLDHGITETEGTSLLGSEELSWEIRRSCLEWCSEHNIEYVEVCASNADFDKCLSVDGDLQGFDRLYGALSAHMWPGMILKSGNRITMPLLPEKEESSDEESEYEFEYEILSGDSAEPCDSTFDKETSVNDISAASGKCKSASQNSSNCDHDWGTACDKREPEPSTSTAKMANDADNGYKTTESDEGTHLDFEELEQLVLEIGNMRENSRLMPDFQRRETAAKLALKMAAMFGGASDDEEEI